MPLKTIKRVCETCGKEFEAKTYDVKRGWGKYCSVKCRNVAHRSQVVCVCLQCGKKFKVPTSHVKRGEGKFCSVKCSAEFHKLRVTRICKTCGKEFEVWESVVQYGSGKFCSRKCTYIGLSNAFSGDGNPLWRGGVSRGDYCEKFNNARKEDVRNEFGRRCWVCDKTEEENGRKLDVHHVDYAKSQGCNGKAWSLIPLCRSCHIKTNHNRWYWFNLLRDYWLYEQIDFVVWSPLF